MTMQMSRPFLPIIAVALAGCATLGSNPNQANIVFLEPKDLSEFNSGIGETYVWYVTPGLPAEIAGLQIDDRIISVNGHQVSTPQELDRAQGNSGEQAELVVVRNGIEQKITMHRKNTMSLFGFRLGPSSTGTIERPSGLPPRATKFMRGVEVDITSQYHPNERVVELLVRLGNGSERTITIAPNSIHITAQGMPLQSLTPEQLADIAFGKDLSSDALSNSGTALPAAPISAPPPYIPPPRANSGGGAVGGFAQGMSEGLDRLAYYRQAQNMIAAQRMSDPAYIQQMQAMQRQQRIQARVKFLQDIQRTILRETTLPPGGQIVGYLYYDNPFGNENIEVAVEIERKTLQFLFGPGKRVQR